MDRDDGREVRRELGGDAAVNLSRRDSYVEKDIVLILLMCCMAWKRIMF